MLRIWAVVLLLSVAATARAQPQHRFVCVDNGKNRLLLIDQSEPAKGWSVECPAGARDLQLLDGGRLLLSHGRGAAEYDVATGRRLEWSVERYSQISTAQRLPSGHTLLGGATAGGFVVYELDVAGKEIAKRDLQGFKDVRLVRPVAGGNLVLTASGPCRVVEVDPSGKTVWQAALAGKGYKAVRLPNGHTLVSTGGDVSVVELNPAGQIVWQVGGKAAHPAAGFDWFSGFDQLPNGNLVVANWLGHGKQGQGPHVVEFDRNNRVVWKWEDHQSAATVTNVLVLR